MAGIRPIIIAVDGPAGSGKSSICAQVSERLGWTYVNTGAIYRAVGFMAQKRCVDLDDEEAVVDLIDDIADKLRWYAKDRQIWCDSEDLTPHLETEEVGKAASKIAKWPLVRERLLPVQRALALSAEVGVLVDGRDIGTVVFPDADLKVFLTASLEARSRRRLNQLGVTATSDDSDCDLDLLQSIKDGIAGRDAQDSGRDTAPLKQASDSIILDTSAMSLPEVIDAMVELLKKKNLL